jgi:surfeit locus 1 family protein
LSSAHSSGSPAGRRWRRPAALPTLLAIGLVALTVSLGNWQIRRAEEKASIQASIDAAGRDAPLSVTADATDLSPLDGRRVRVRGSFIAEHTVYIDNRTRKGVAGFHVVTPVRIEGSQRHVLVLRGWIARDARERTRLPQVPTPQGLVEIDGLGQASIAQVLELREAPVPGPGDRLWQNIDFDRFRAWSGLELLPLMIRETGLRDDGLVREMPPAGGDVAKHRGYAFQWYSMAAATIGLWTYLTFFRRRERSAEPS